ncbi:hypothetical protein LWI29_004855 [Acer saccharum]|uniref:Uncharacterized protein n=1 Tax=Acer saccharum TaxID=4024 RepID=A0AA39S6T8_ACESA|nr:hypothetical protein LWI29_004855 [Acer saccharum]
MGSMIGGGGKGCFCGGCWWCDVFGIWVVEKLKVAAMEMVVADGDDNDGGSDDNVSNGDNEHAGADGIGHETDEMGGVPGLMELEVITKVPEAMGEIPDEIGLLVGPVLSLNPTENPKTTTTTTTITTIEEA